MPGIATAPRIHRNHALTGRTRHRFDRIAIGGFFWPRVIDLIILEVEVSFDVCTPSGGGKVEFRDTSWRDAHPDDFLRDVAAPTIRMRGAA